MSAETLPPIKGATHTPRQPQPPGAGAGSARRRMGGRTPRAAPFGTPRSVALDVGMSAQPAVRPGTAVQNFAMGKVQAVLQPMLEQMFVSQPSDPSSYIAGFLTGENADGAKRMDSLMEQIAEATEKREATAEENAALVEENAALRKQIANLGDAQSLADEIDRLRQQLAESETQREACEAELAKAPSPAAASDLALVDGGALDDAELASLAERLGIGAAELEQVVADFGAGARITIQIRDDERPELNTAGFRHPHHVLVADQNKTLAEEEAAATKIAAVSRGKQGRKKAAGRKIEADLGLTGSEEETAAIARMQAQQRGKMARQEMAEQQNAASKIAAVQRGKQDRQRVQGMKIEKELGLTGSEDEAKSIAKMQAAQRGKMARKEMEEQQAAATKLQAVQRGNMARKG